MLVVGVSVRNRQAKLSGAKRRQVRRGLGVQGKGAAPFPLLPRYYRLANVAQQLIDDSLLRWAVSGTITADSLLPAPTGAASGVRAFMNTQ
jgi:hypothetical protein